MDKAIEAAARKIDPLAFEKYTHAARGFEHMSEAEWGRVVTLRRNRAMKIARKMMLAFLDELRKEIADG